MFDFIPDNPYILLTPGPLSTSKGVRNAMLRDWCTWDSDYNEGIVQNIRQRLLSLAAKNPEEYTVILMQGSGSFSVEATIGSTISKNDKLLIIQNGAYGQRMVKMAQVLQINHLAYDLPETQSPNPDKVANIIASNPDITHVAFVHCETTTGILNPLQSIVEVAKKYEKIFILDAMSSFGGIPFDVADLGIDFLISSSNKCIQGVPGFGFVIAKREVLTECKGNARSLCLDLVEQWEEMDKSGKWRYTSPTHIVRAFYQALDELDAEGGIQKRYERYRKNHRILVDGMRALGFNALLPEDLQSPIITSFLYPNSGFGNKSNGGSSSGFDFKSFYHSVKERGFVLYPGKISQADTFRIGNIGEVYPEDIESLLDVIEDVRKEI